MTSEHKSYAQEQTEQQIQEEWRKYWEHKREQRYRKEESKNSFGTVSFWFGIMALMALSFPAPLILAKNIAFGIMLTPAICAFVAFIFVAYDTVKWKNSPRAQIMLFIGLTAGLALTWAGALKVGPILAYIGMAVPIAITLASIIYIRRKPLPPIDPAFKNWIETGEGQAPDVIPQPAPAETYYRKLEEEEADSAMRYLNLMGLGMILSYLIMFFIGVVILPYPIPNLPLLIAPPIVAMFITPSFLLDQVRWKNSPGAQVMLAIGIVGGMLLTAVGFLGQFAIVGYVGSGLIALTLPCAIYVRYQSLPPINKASAIWRKVDEKFPLNAQSSLELAVPTPGLGYQPDAASSLSTRNPSASANNIERKRAASDSSSSATATVARSLEGEVSPAAMPASNNTPTGQQQDRKRNTASPSGT